MGIFIPHKDLANLKKYKYQSEDRSIVTKYVLKPFWQKFVKVFPLWLAPNVVTLSGFGFIVLNLVLLFSIDPYLNEPSPSWCYISYALGLFLYQTFDACDGIQARRTGQSGPLGELFDHCVDAINTSLSTIIFGSVFQMGWGWYLFICQFATLCNFYLSTWEEYHTHLLYLSEFSGPVEGILLICGAFLITAIWGPGIWQYELFQLNLSSIGYSSNHSVTITELFMAWAALGLYFNIDAAKKNVYKAVASSQHHKALAGLIPFFGFYATVLLELLLFPQILPSYGFPFYLTVASLMAFAVGRIITAHLTLQGFPMVNPPMLIPAAEIVLIKLLSWGFGYLETECVGAVLYTGLGLSVGIHAMFITEIIYEITTYLDIYALSIKHPKEMKMM